MLVKLVCFALIAFDVVGPAASMAVLHYDLAIKTSSRQFAGTNAKVGIQLIGRKNKYFERTNYHWFSGKRRKLFKSGAIDHVSLQSKDIGDLHEAVVMIFHDMNNRSDPWSVDWIQIRYKGIEFKAYFYKTLFENQQTETSYAIALDGCRPGFDYVVEPSRQYCKDRNECEYTCMEELAICTNFDGGYNCSCEPGFERIGDSCQDINECYYPQNTACADIKNAECENDVGSYRCVCQKGYKKNIRDGEIYCEDINECKSRETNTCQQGCENLPGTFACYCKNGYKLAPDKSTCIEANECVHNICNITTSTCYATATDYHCVCKEGYAHENQNLKICSPRKCLSLAVSDEKVIVHPKSCLINGAMHYGDHCDFTCKKGYRLHEKSSREFKCNEDGFWKPLSRFVTGNKRGREPIRSFAPRCVPTFCKALPAIRNGYIVPLSCTTSGIQHGGKCNYYCNRGYRLIGSFQVKCKEEKFDENFRIPHCVKVPNIQCPEDVTLSLPIDSNTTKLGKKYKGVVSNMPEANIRSEPSTLSPVTEFPLGTTLIHMYAFNYIGDESMCQYRVSVKDTSAPTILFCPEDMYIDLEEAQDVFIEWEEPIFHDNTGIKKVRKSQKNKMKYAPISFNVVYDAVDYHNNVATCAFTVHIKVATCSFDNVEGAEGAINKFCVMMAGKRAFCNAQCPNGKTFENISPTQGSLKNAWWCMGGNWLGVKRVPDCVDFSPMEIGMKICPEGSTGTYDYRDAKSLPVCGKCPKGTHFVNRTKSGRTSCEPCPINTYQDEEGQSFCKTCRYGFGTGRDRQISSESCQGLCPPGYTSRTGFVDFRAGGCIPCPKNTFNPYFGKRRCYPCPPGYITEDNGSSRKSECRSLPKQLIAFPSPEIEMFEGSSFYFDCVSYAIPPPHFTWSVKTLQRESSDRHFVEVIPSDRGFVLSRYTIVDAIFGDTGSYRCVAYYGEKEREFLTVRVNVIRTGITDIRVDERKHVVRNAPNILMESASLKLWDFILRKRIKVHNL